MSTKNARDERLHLSNWSAGRRYGNQVTQRLSVWFMYGSTALPQWCRALFLTGTHLGDIIRYNVTLSRAAGSTTPWNQTFGPDKGSQACMPLPQVEFLNNPLLH
jgi:hypothetical protein